MTYSARLSNSFDGTWELYVASDRPTAEWPEYLFSRTAPVPTLDERSTAIAALGYEIADGAKWEWHELASGAMDRVELLAAIDVRPIGGAA
jgi:hypothetical protein